jgi:hypothetical protein
MGLLQHSDDFMQEIYTFVQPTRTVGVAIILRLPDGNFIFQKQEVQSGDYEANPGGFEALSHEFLQSIIIAARRGPGSGEILMPRTFTL